MMSVSRTAHVMLTTLRPAGNSALTPARRPRTPRPAAVTAHGAPNTAVPPGRPDVRSATSRAHPAYPPPSPPSQARGSSLVPRVHI